MPLFKHDNLVIAGMSACVPKNSYDNSDYSYISVEERSTLIKTTGIKNRRVASAGVTTSDLVVKAAEKLIRDLSWDKEEIELLIFVSQSRDYILPCTAIMLQDKLGLTKNCMAFDVPLGCSGFTNGLNIAASLLNSGDLQKAILLVGDVSTISTPFEDKSTYPLFGDAACAIAIEKSSSCEPWFFDSHSDGKGYEAIIVPDGGLRNTVTDKTFEVKNYGEGINRHRHHLWLNGMDVFSFSVNEVPKSINQFLEQTKQDKQNVDYFIMHQANLLMNETIRKLTGFDKQKTPYSLYDFGNTSSASIPLTIITQLKHLHKNNNSYRLLLSGFGVGLSWSNALINLNNLVICDLIEV